MKLYEKLFNLRKEKNITQQELSEILGVSRQAISRWEMGTSFPSVENFLQLSRLYNVSIDFLINDELDSEKDIPVAKATDACAKFGYKQVIKRIVIFFVIVSFSIIVGFLMSSVITFFLFALIALVSYIVAHVLRIIFIYLKRKGERGD